MSTLEDISVRHEDFDVGAEIAALSGDGTAGAVASFVGAVRGGGSEKDAIFAMTLEHYPGMTERALADIVALARQRWALGGVRVIHRIGRLLPGERIVFVGVACRHRGEAFAACEFIMDYLKTQAPFWKKEETAQGARWVDARDSDDAALERWQEKQ
ncbi:MAG TPA: molybdopterin synthase catalytic subunit MoaE [Rhodocyclaceae bacterium]|nr:molybdopterin synthase catalytic subunit MoaE [Rhodocyclaceae bacterium]